MKALLNVAGILAILGGFYFVYRALDAVSISAASAASASAVQISQVYNVGAFHGTMAVACFVFALCCVVAAGQAKNANE